MTARAEKGRRGYKGSALVWGGAAALLALPLVAMRFTREVAWTASDFAVMGAMLFAACGAWELATRASGSLAYRAGAGIAIVTAFLTIWINLAAGMIGSEDNPYNLAFAGIVLLALAGGAVARFRPGGLAATMAAAAVAQVAAAALGLSADLSGGLLSAAFALPWLLAAALFRKAARE